jgi:hypothetical protein
VTGCVEGFGAEVKKGSVQLENRLIGFYFHPIKHCFSVSSGLLKIACVNRLKKASAACSRTSFFLNKIISVRPFLDTIPSLITLFSKILLAVAKAWKKVYYRKKYQGSFKVGGLLCAG